MKIAKYLRVACVEQDGEGIVPQREGLARFCAAHDLQAVATFEDSGVSGVTALADRPAGGALLAAAAAGEFDTLLVTELARLSRSSAELGRIGGLLWDLNIALIVVAEPPPSPGAPAPFHLARLGRGG